MHLVIFGNQDMFLIANLETAEFVGREGEWVTFEENSYYMLFPLETK